MVGCKSFNKGRVKVSSASKFSGEAASKAVWNTIGRRKPIAKRPTLHG